jgi:hypothetical protein
MTPHSFIGSHIVFATNHGKSAAAKAACERHLNATVSELPIDSDSLGTFSGEIPRTGSMIDALRGKIHLARAVTDAPLILVSEGSYGSLGGIGALSHGVEMLMLYDSRAKVEILEEYITTTTNYATRRISNHDQLLAFLTHISFGQHALVLAPDGVPLAGTTIKGIITVDKAEAAFLECRAKSPTQTVVAMSDMRAHLNPTRMKAIAECCELLAQRLSTLCPRCESGGFGLLEARPGLPCMECGAATSRTKTESHGCRFCGKTVSKNRSDGISYADPSECPRCNP